MNAMRAAALGMSAILLAGSTAVSQSKELVIGTWELNVAKSKYVPGPAPKSETRTYVAGEKEITATGVTVEADGKTRHSAWSLDYGSKDTPITGNPELDMLSVKKVDDWTISIIQKKAGKVVATGSRTISKDGKSMTVVVKGTNSKGQPLEITQVFERKP